MKSPIFLLCCTLAASATAQAQLSLQGELRTRAEYRHGFAALPAPDADAAFFISQRSRIKFGYKTSALSFGLSLQDVRVWGDEAQTKDEPSIGLHEAWADVELSDVLGVKLGRQELVYDDHRLLGNSDWNQQGRSHDALVLHYRNNGWNADMGGAFNQKAEALFGTRYSTANYKTLAYLWIGKQIDTSLKFSLIGITDGLQKTDSTTDIANRYTYGGNGEYSTAGFTIKATLYGQSGIDRSGKDIAAYFAAASLGYTFGNAGVAVGYELVSGTAASEREENHTFNTLYPTNHKFYGTLDYFPLPDTRNGGLQDIYATVQYDPAQQLKLRLDAHSFSLAADIANGGNVPDKALGTEIDFTATYAASPVVTLSGGYSQMFASETMEMLTGGSSSETANWMWLMLSIKPTFLP